MHTRTHVADMHAWTWRMSPDRHACIRRLASTLSVRVDAWGSCARGYPQPQPTPWGSGFRVQGSGFRVQGSGFRVQGLGFRV